MRAIIIKSVFAILALYPIEGAGQCNNEAWTTDTLLRASAIAQETLYKNEVRNGNFQKATAPIRWLLANAPQARQDLYTYGVEVYEKLATDEKDPARKNIYLDSMVEVFKLQNANCGTHHDLATAKLMYYYKHIKTSNPGATLALFDSMIVKRGNHMSNQLIVAYMEVVKYNFSKYHKMSDDQVIRYYNRAMRIAEFKQREARSKGIPDDEFLELKDDIDALLFSMVVIDCNFVKKNLGPRFREHPDDPTIARKILSFMLQNQCFDDPLWLSAGELLYKKHGQKDYTLAKALGLRYFTLQNYVKAQPFFDDALEMAPDVQEKAATLVYLGRIKGRTDKPAARKLYMEALSVDRGNKEAYERIGDLYYNSENDCGSKTNEVDDALVYILASDYYKRSGNDKKVAAAREKFPTKAAVAAAGYVSGTEKLVECWIEETTTIRTKD